jgi:hypothetical protein
MNNGGKVYYILTNKFNNDLIKIIQTYLNGEQEKNSINKEIKKLIECDYLFNSNIQLIHRVIYYNSHYTNFYKGFLHLQI